MAGGRTPYLGPSGATGGRTPYLGSQSASAGRTPYLGGGQPSKGGGGGFLHAVGHALGLGAHWTAQKADLAAHDVKGIPGGIVEVGKATAPGMIYNAVVHNQSPLSTFHKQTEPLAKGYAKQTLTTLEHPLRDPFQTVILAAPLASGVAKAGLAANAARTGDLAGAARIATPLRRIPVTPRSIRTTGHVAMPVEGGAPGEVTLKATHATVPLHASTNAAVRLVQHAYDAVIQKALDERPQGRLAAHAAKRVAGSINETGRIQTRLANVPANLIERAGRGKLGLPRKLAQDALRLTSENSTPEEAAHFHGSQAVKGVAPETNGPLAVRYQRLAATGAVVRDAKGNAVIDAERFPKLAALDARIAKGQTTVDRIAEEHGLMTSEGLEARRNGPARIRAGGEYVGPGDAAAKRLARLEREHSAAVDQIVQAKFGKRPGQNEVNARTAHNKALAARGLPPGKTVTEGRRAAVEQEINDAIARSPDNPTLKRWADRLAEIDRLRAQQNPEHLGAVETPVGGIVGGESARPGRGFVTLKTSEKAPRKGTATVARGPVIGKARSFIPAKTATYSGLEKGLVPDNTTGLVETHMRDAQRYVARTRHAAKLVRTGSDLRRTTRDILVRDERVPASEIKPETKQLLGTERSTLNTVPEEATPKTLAEHAQELVPGLRDKFSRDEAQPVGQLAPKGYKWVDRNALGDLGEPVTPRGKPAKLADTINSGVTAMTVYFKPGHLATRTFTNAVTNIIQGSARPDEVAKSFQLWHALTDDERSAALAAGGQHGIEALPHEGTGRVSKVAGTGARWWAHRIDSPFRFNAVAYEARKAGINTPAEFRSFLHDLEHQDGLSASRVAQVDWVAKRANRASIMYDGLNAAEKRYLARAFWFFPWVKGATRFAGHTVAEHPVKAAALAVAGQRGRQQQLSALGPVPSYEQGLIPLGGGARPRTTDLTTFTPYGSAADVLEAAARPSNVSGFLNPTYGALLTGLTGVNSSGNKTKSPIGDAASELFSPTPEAQIISALMHRPSDARLFRKTPGSQAARALFGPAAPRRVNRAVLNTAAAREKAGR